MTEMALERRCGRVAVVGRSNAGKSTLVNRLVGDKVAIVSPVPQTTRNAILGVCHAGPAQVVLVDTPGFHKPAHVLNELMLEETQTVLEGVDAVLVVIDASDRVGRGDAFVLERVRASLLPYVIALNKVDAVKPKEALLPLIERVATPPEGSGAQPPSAIVPISALDGDGVDALLQEVIALLPVGDPEFPTDVTTDQSEHFRISELIREKVLQATRQEVPHATTVIIESIADEDMPQGARRLVVHAAVVVEKDSQKGILIGKGGSMLSRIGTAARKDIQALLGRKCHLQLFVKVAKDWRDDRRAVARVFEGTRDGSIGLPDPSMAEELPERSGEEE